VIPEAAVEAAARCMADSDRATIDWTEIDWTEYAIEARTILEAAAPHMMPKMEWGIFRATDDDTATPIENRRYRSREIAERQIRHDFADPKYWVVRGRSVGEWAK